MHLREAPRPVTELSHPDRVRVVLTDIDGTLTDNGRLGADAYAAMWRLHEAGVRVVPVTGRPAGWCDLIVRQWPVAGVVGENGAFAMYLSGGRRRTLYHDEAARDASDRLAELRDRVTREVPEVRIAADQPYREFDVAFDFAEDEPPLGLETALRVRDICREAGAHAKISSIHVNAWFGDYDKRAMSFEFLYRIVGVALEEVADAALFVGDSPNDAPLFAAFPQSVGVASVMTYGDALETAPAYVTPSDGGAGFVEVVEALLG